MKAQVRYKGEERKQLVNGTGRRRAGEVLGSWDKVHLLRNDGKTQWVHISCKGGGKGSEGG